VKVLYGYKGASKELRAPVMAIGVFDGVHKGHKKVLEGLLDDADKNGDKVVMTFDPHPRTVLCPGKTAPRIMSLEHRLSIFEKMGMDAVIVLHFTEAMAEMTAEDFVKNVIRGTGAKKVYVGGNFYFGKGRKGDPYELIRMGEKYGIHVKKISPVTSGKKTVSSTWLRQLISSGKITTAGKLLERPVSVLGTVVKGDQRGRTLGAPTANIDPHQEVIPPPGVYAVMVDVGGTLRKGVLNVGFKPTFYGSHLKKREEPHIEVNLMGYKGDLYGTVLEIFFIKRLRSEKRFGSPQALSAQIQRDTTKAERILCGTNFSKGFPWRG